MSDQMTYAEWLRQQACEGKLRFPDEREARVAARDSAVTYREPYSAWGAYECEYCRAWHVGHAKGWTEVSRRG